MTTEGREDAGEQNELDLDGIAQRILSGEFIDIDELCRQFPAQASQMNRPGIPGDSNS